MVGRLLVVGLQSQDLLELLLGLAQPGALQTQHTPVVPADDGPPVHLGLSGRGGWVHAIQLPERALVVVVNEGGADGGDLAPEGLPPPHLRRGLGLPVLGVEVAGIQVQGLAELLQGIDVVAVVEQARPLLHHLDCQGAGLRVVPGPLRSWGDHRFIGHLRLRNSRIRRRLRRHRRRGSAIQGLWLQRLQFTRGAAGEQDVPADIGSTPQNNDPRHQHGQDQPTARAAAGGGRCHRRRGHLRGRWRRLGLGLEENRRLRFEFFRSGFLRLLGWRERHRLDLFDLVARRLRALGTARQLLFDLLQRLLGLVVMRQDLQDLLVLITRLGEISGLHEVLGSEPHLVHPDGLLLENAPHPIHPLLGVRVAVLQDEHPRPDLDGPVQVALGLLLITLGEQRGDALVGILTIGGRYRGFCHRRQLGGHGLRGHQRVARVLQRVHVEAQQVLLAERLVSRGAKFTGSRRRTGCGLERRCHVALGLRQHLLGLVIIRVHGKDTPTRLHARRPVFHHQVVARQRELLGGIGRGIRPRLQARCALLHRRIVRGNLQQDLHALPGGVRITGIQQLLHPLHGLLHLRRIGCDWGGARPASGSLRAEVLGEQFHHLQAFPGPLVLRVFLEEALPDRHSLVVLPVVVMPRGLVQLLLQFVLVHPWSCLASRKSAWQAGEQKKWFSPSRWVIRALPSGRKVLQIRSRTILPVSESARGACGREGARRGRSAPTHHRRKHVPRIHRSKRPTSPPLRRAAAADGCEAPPAPEGPAAGPRGGLRPPAPHRNPPGGPR